MAVSAPLQKPGLIRKCAKLKQHNKDTALKFCLLNNGKIQEMCAINFLKLGPLDME